MKNLLKEKVWGEGSHVYKVKVAGQKRCIVSLMHCDTNSPDVKARQILQIVVKDPIPSWTCAIIMNQITWDVRKCNVANEANALRGRRDALLGSVHAGTWLQTLEASFKAGLNFGEDLSRESLMSLVQKHKSELPPQLSVSQVS